VLVVRTRGSGGGSGWPALFLALATVQAVVGPGTQPPGQGRSRSRRLFCEKCDRWVYATRLSDEFYRCGRVNSHRIRVSDR